MNYFKITLNGDGMVNVHPEVDTERTEDGRGYSFNMTTNAYNAYLKKNGLHRDGQKLIGNDDKYVYGAVNKLY